MGSDRTFAEAKEADLHRNQVSKRNEQLLEIYEMLHTLTPEEREAWGIDPQRHELPFMIFRLITALRERMNATSTS